MAPDRLPAAGGVLIDGEGRVLLREPLNHYYGYVWTFAKGKPDSGESLRDAAVREVRDETGIPVKIVDRIPGMFVSADSETVFFLMEQDGPAGCPDCETVHVCWYSVEQARLKIQETTNEAGRERDLAVLAAAVRLWTTRRSS